MVGEALCFSGSGKATKLVGHARNRRLDPYRGVRVGEAAHPGPGSTGKGEQPRAPPKPPDHYAVLGLTRGAALEQVKKAYRKKSLTEHPDKGGTAARFQRLDEGRAFQG